MVVEGLFCGPSCGSTSACSDSFQSGLDVGLGRFDRSVSGAALGGGSLRFNVLFKKHNAESFSRTSCGSSVDKKINPFELR